MITTTDIANAIANSLQVSSKLNHSQIFLIYVAQHRRTAAMVLSIGSKKQKLADVTQDGFTTFFDERLARINQDNLELRQMLEKSKSINDAL